MNDVCVCRVHLFSFSFPFLSVCVVFIFCCICKSELISSFFLSLNTICWVSNALQTGWHFKRDISVSSSVNAGQYEALIHLLCFF